MIGEHTLDNNQSKKEEEEDCPPDLEEVDHEQNRLEELEKSKALKHKEWLNKVVVE